VKRNQGIVGYKFFGFFLKPLFKLYYHPQIIGKENIPSAGSLVIAGNHKHIMDQCLTIVATKRMIHWMAKREYFDNWKVSWFFKATGVISVDRAIKDEHAKKEALAVLEDGGAIGIFPEGTRNKTDSFLLPFKFGAVSMAQKTDSYIVPFGIGGDYRFRSKNLKIVYGKAFKVGTMNLEEANNKLRQEVEKLMIEASKQ